MPSKEPTARYTLLVPPGSNGDKYDDEYELDHSSSAASPLISSSPSSPPPSSSRFSRRPKASLPFPTITPKKLLCTFLPIGLLLFLGLAGLHPSSPISASFRSSSSSSSACPAPHSPRRSLAGVSYAPSDCVAPALHANASSSEQFPYSLKICTRPSVPGECNAATIFIAPLDPSSCTTARALSNDPDLDALIKERFGPAEFFVLVDGAERYSSVGDPGLFQRYGYEVDGEDTVGNEEPGEEGSACGYRIEVALKNAGEATMQIWQFFDDFKAFDEIDREWPENLQLPLLAEPFTLPACPASCAQHFAPTPLPNTTAPLVPHPPLHKGHHMPHLPSCPLGSPDTLPGAFLPYPPGETMEDVYPPSRWYGSHQKSGKYGYVPEGCVWRHVGDRFAEHGLCAGVGEGAEGGGITGEQGEVWVYGDSHGRVMYDSIVHRLEGNRNYSTVSAKAGDKNFTLGAQTLRCYWDPQVYHLDYDVTCEDLAGASALIVSTGSHQSTQGDTAAFNRTLSFLEKFAACPPNIHGNQLKLVYVLMPPQPPRQDKDSREYKDHRTITRLKHWTTIARGRALAAGWHVMDQMALYAPYAMEPLETDKAHFLDTDGLEEGVTQVLAQLGGCSSAAAQGWREGLGWEVEVRQEGTGWGVGIEEYLHGVGHMGYRRRGHSGGLGRGQ